MRLALAGGRHACGLVVMDCHSGYLRIQLPSGRYICYAGAKIEDDGSISYRHWRNRKWERTTVYGGKSVEHQAQAVSRDLLAAAILRVEANGIPVVLHVHDDIAAETRIGEFPLKDFCKLVAQQPHWAKGLPLAAKGFQGVRYGK